MKTFSNIRQLAESAVFSKKIGGVPVKIVNSRSKFETYIDGDKLDTYDSKDEAIQMATKFIKHLRK